MLRGPEGGFGGAAWRRQGKHTLFLPPLSPSSRLSPAPGARSRWKREEKPFLVFTLLLFCGGFFFFLLLLLLLKLEGSTLPDPG